MIFSRGIKYMLISALALTLMQAFIKYLQHIHVYELIFFRSGITWVICLVYLLRNRIPLLGNQRKLLLLRSFFGVIGMTFFLTTVQRIPFGSAVSIKYLSPIFTAVFALVFLKEKVKPIQGLYFLIAIAGVFLMKGFDDRIDTVNLVLGIIGAFGVGAVGIVIRKIGSGDHPTVVVFYYMTFATLTGILLTLGNWVAPSPTDWLFLIAIGVLGYYGQVFMTKSFQAEAASRVVSVRYSDTVFALVIGYIWFGEGYSLLSFLGIILVIAGMFLNVAVKYQDPE